MVPVRQSFFPRYFQPSKRTTLQEYTPLPRTPTPDTITTSVKPLHKWRDGYHFGVLCCTITAATVLIINIILMVVLITKQHILQAGDCEETKRLDEWLHVVINILSTLLLGASNYCMQCLAAPTRHDIDKAHRQKLWMDIGVPSIRNIPHISWRRRILWGFLFFSSVPLHLIYNSVVFANTSISEWAAFTVTDDFLSGANYNAVPFSDPLLGVTAPLSSSDMMKRLGQLRNSSSSLIRLEVKDCLTAYKPPLNSEWGDVLVFSMYTDTDNSFLHMESTWDQCTNAGASPCCLNGCNQEPGRPNLSGNWTTPDFNNFTMGELPVTDNWTAGEYGVSYVSHCMATKVQQHCNIRFGLPLMIAVIICNLIKLICMASIVWRMDPYPLATIGDAIASFLDSPDMTTVGNCLGAKGHFDKTSPWTKFPLQYHPKRHRRFHSASLKRWLTTTLLCGLALLASLTLLGICLNQVENSSIGRLNDFSLGFGAINTEAMINISGALHRSIFANVLIANTPQLLLSFLYFTYNSLWTCMLLADEWARYATARKPLRVTSPTGKQRSTYRLQLPYRYSIPLLVISGTLHWLVSQSIFLVSLSTYNPDGTLDLDSKANITSCGFSPIALLTFVLVASTVLALSVANGCRCYKNNGIPLAGSCSAAISAACHPPLGDDHASSKGVMWGACGSDVDGDWTRTMKLVGNAPGMEGVKQDGGEFKVGHCSFTSFAVEEPVEGELYAGTSSGFAIQR